MDLKHFIVESLVQISEGIREAQKIGTGARFGKPPDPGKPFGYGEDDDKDVLAVSFDLAVAVIKDDKNPETQRITVLAAHSEKEPDLAVPSQNLSHISFTVPVYWADMERHRGRETGKRQGPVIPDLDISL